MSLHIMSGATERQPLASRTDRGTAVGGPARDLVLVVSRSNPGMSKLYVADLAADGSAVGEPCLLESVQGIVEDTA